MSELTQDKVNELKEELRLRIKIRKRIAREQGSEWQSGKAEGLEEALGIVREKLD